MDFSIGIEEVGDDLGYGYHYFKCLFSVCDFCTSQSSAHLGVNLSCHITLELDTSMSR